MLPAQLQVTDSRGYTRLADSTNEYFLAKVLADNGVEFYFQVGVAQYSLDFLVFLPLSHGIEIEGEAWHTKQEDEFEREALIKASLDLIELWQFTGEETKDYESCYQVCRRYRVF